MMHCTTTFSRVIRAGLITLTFLVLLLSMADRAYSHVLGKGYIWLNVYNDRIEGRLEVTLEDLNKALPLDLDGNGKVSDEEFASSVQGVREYIGDRIAFKAGIVPYDVVLGNHELKFFDSRRYLEIVFTVSGDSALPPSLSISYNLLFDADSNHQGLLLIERL